MIESPRDAWFWPRIGFLLLVFAGATYTIADADLWGHLRFGLDLLGSHHLTSVDPYSFTQDRPWINHEWLSELQMAIAWHVGGPFGLTLLKGALVFLVVLLFWTARNPMQFGAKLIVLTVMFISTVQVTSSIRPQVWTFACFALLCRTLQSDSWRVKWWLPSLFGLWANCHGGWIVGFAVLAAWAGVEGLIDLRSGPRWALLVAVCLGATLINPYGFGLWRFLAETVRPSRTQILEWKPLFYTPVSNWISWTVAVVVATWAALKKYPHYLSTTAVLALLAYGSFRVMRVESLFIVAAAILLTPAIAKAWPSKATPLSVQSSGDRAALVYLTAVPLIAALRLFTITLPCVPNILMFRPDRVAAASLRSAQPGRIVTYFNWGEYAIWHFGPKLLVSIDGRRETVYSDAQLMIADNVLRGTPAGLQSLAGWHADYVWLPEGAATSREWLKTHGYRVEIETPESFVAVRADHPRLNPRLTPVDVDQKVFRCFPE